MSDPVIGSAGRAQSPTRTGEPRTVRQRTVEPGSITLPSSDPTGERRPYQAKMAGDIEGLRTLDAPPLEAAQEQIPEEVRNGLTSSDAQVRSRSLDRLGELARQGNHQALEALLAVLSDERSTRELSYNDRRELLQQVLQKAVAAEEHFRPQDFNHLTGMLDNSELKGQVKEFLTRRHTQGEGGVLTALRQAAGDDDHGAQEESAEMLAVLLNEHPPQQYDAETRSADYLTLLRRVGDHSIDEDSPIWQRLTTGVGEGNEALLAGLRGNLELDSTNMLKTDEIGNSLRLLGTDEEYQPPRELLERWSQQTQDSNNYSARAGTRLLAEALRVSGRSENYREFGHRALSRSDLEEDLARDTLTAFLRESEHFRPEDYRAVGIQLENFRVADQARDFLTEAHGEGKTEVATALRGIVSEGESSSDTDEAADLLARLNQGSEGAATDYTLLLGQLDRTNLERTATWEQLQRGVAEGDTALLDGLRDKLSLDIDDYKNRDIMKRSLRLLDGDPEFQAPAELVQRLVAAAQEGGHDGQEAARLLGEAIRASARPEEYQQYAHLVVAARFGEHDTIQAATGLAAAHARDGGTEPLDFAHGILTDPDANHEMEWRALRIYREAPASLRQQDLAALEEILNNGPYSAMGADIGSAGQVLGEAGKHLPEGERFDQLRQILREALTSENRETRMRASQAMSQFADRLKLEDVRALLDSGALYSDGAVAEALPNLSDEDKQALLGTLRSRLNSEDRRQADDAVRWMAALGEHLSPADVQALGGRRSEGRTEALKAALSARSPEARDQAALTLIGHGRQNLDQATLRTLSRVAENSQNPEVRRALQGILRSSPLNEQNLAALGESFSRRFSDRLRNAREGSDLHELAQLYAAAQMAGDPESGYADRIDQEALNRRIQEVLNRPSVQRAMQDCRSAAIRETMPELRGRDPGEAQADYVLSADFEAKLRLADEDERSQLIETELGRLASIDPEKAQEVQQALSLRMVSEAAQERPLEFLQSLSEEDRVKALEDLLNTAGVGRKAAGIARALSSALHRADPSSLRGEDQGQLLVRMLNGLRGAPGIPDSAIQTAVQGIEALDRRGALGSSMGALALASVFMRGVPQNAEQALRSGADLMEVASNLDSFARLAGVSDEVLAGSGRLARISRVAAFLGPAGDVLTAGLDGWGAYQDFSDGDTVGGIAKSAGALSAVGGLAALALMSGPGAPVVAGICLVVGVGAAIVDWIWGESPEETMLRQLGVLRR